MFRHALIAEQGGYVERRCCIDHEAKLLSTGDSTDPYLPQVAPSPGLRLLTQVCEHPEISLNRTAADHRSSVVIVLLEDPIAKSARTTATISLVGRVMPHPSKNSESRLPLEQGGGVGSRKVVVNSNAGEVFYTWTRYGDSGSPAFVRIR